MTLFWSPEARLIPRPITVDLALRLLKTRGTEVPDWTKDTVDNPHMFLDFVLMVLGPDDDTEQIAIQGEMLPKENCRMEALVEVLKNVPAFVKAFQELGVVVDATFPMKVPVPFRREHMVLPMRVYWLAEAGMHGLEWWNFFCTKMIELDPRVLINSEPDPTRFPLCSHCREFVATQSEQQGTSRKGKEEDEVPTLCSKCRPPLVWENNRCVWKDVKKAYRALWWWLEVLPESTMDMRNDLRDHGFKGIDFKHDYFRRNNYPVAVRQPRRRLQLDRRGFLVQEPLTIEVCSGSLDETTYL